MSDRADITNFHRQPDLQAQSHVEVALRQSEQRFHAIFNQTFQWICLVAPDGTLLEANQTALDLAGLSSEQVIGRFLWDTYWWAISEETQAQLKLAIARGTQGEWVQYDVKVQGRDRIVTLDFSLRPVKDETGQIIFLVAEGQDITDRQSTKQALQEKEEFLRSIYDGVEQSIFVVDVLKDGNFRFVGLNPAHEYLTGISSEELQGKTPEQVLPPAAAAAIRQRYQACVEAGETIAYEECLPFKGEQTWWITTLTPLRNDRDRIYRLIGSSINISDRKQAEERVKASLCEKEVLLKEIHHRVKNNLQIVDGLLKMQARRASDPQVNSVLQDSQNRVASIALVHEKLYRSADLANIEFAQYIRDLTAHLLESYSVPSNGVMLKTNTDAVFLDIETAIPCGLIINELVSNALKYAFPDGRAGEIGIELSQTNPRAEMNQARNGALPDVNPSDLTLIVQDNGVGLPPNFDITNTQSLGMTLIRGLVDQLEGTLTIEVDVGTKFCIRFRHHKV
jgi:PAS domain S-box-containing protein